MEHHPFTWFGTIGHLTGAWENLAIGIVVTVLLVFFAMRVRRGIPDTDAALMPDEGVTARNVGEAFVEAMISLTKSAIPDGAERYVPLLATFFAYILACNLIGLIPGFVPPTSHFNITVALGCVAFGAYLAYGVREHGIAAYSKHCLGPVLLMARLMLVIEIFTGLTYAVIPVIFYCLGFFVCIVQSFVFTMLSAIYISGAVAHAHGGHEEHHH
jgi:F-type H+-transporting ATPase subunit a